MSVEKTEWKNEYKQIKKKVASFEIDILKLFPFLQTTTMKSELIAMSTNEEKLTFDRSKEREEIFINLSFVRKDIRSFKDKIKYFDKSDDSLRKIEEITTTLESKMSDFQSKQMNVFDDLTKNEERLLSELDIFSDRLDSYESNQKLLENKKKTQKYQSYNAIPEENDGEDTRNNNNASFFSDNNKENFDANNNSNEEEEKEIEGIDKELEKVKKKIESIDRNIRNNGGPGCGWPDDEHKDFLKLRTKHKNNINRAVFLDDCQSIFPLYNKKDIQEHIERFRTYNNLDAEKKAMVENYKILKDERKRKMLTIIDEEQRKNEENNKETTQIRKEEHEKQKKMREKLQEWKRKKLSLKEVEIEKKTMEEIERKKQEEKKLQEKKGKITQKLKEYKENKEIERKTKTQQTIKRNFDPQELERIKEKEEQILQRRKELLERKKSSEEEKRKRMDRLLETKNVKFGYVESKLNEETKAILGKKTEKFDPKKGDQPRIADTFGGMLGKGPSRAIPAWRQGG